jgi:hypothetical protein
MNVGSAAPILTMGIGDQETWAILIASVCRLWKEVDALE